MKKYSLFVLHFISGDLSFHNVFLDESEHSSDLETNPLLSEVSEFSRQFDSAFENLEPPIDDYMFSLGDGEGISELFDVDNFNIEDMLPTL